MTSQTQSKTNPVWKRNPLSLTKVGPHISFGFLGSGSHLTPSISSKPAARQPLVTRSTRLPQLFDWPEDQCETSSLEREGMGKERHVAHVLLLQRSSSHQRSNPRAPTPSDWTTPSADAASRGGRAPRIPHLGGVKLVPTRRSRTGKPDAPEPRTQATPRVRRNESNGSFVYGSID